MLFWSDNKERQLINVGEQLMAITLPMIKKEIDALRLKVDTKIKELEEERKTLSNDLQQCQNELAEYKNINIEDITI